jgi:hypothetical protein
MARTTATIICIFLVLLLGAWPSPILGTFVLDKSTKLLNQEELAATLAALIPSAHTAIVPADLPEARPPSDGVHTMCDYSCMSTLAVKTAEPGVYTLDMT